MASLGQQTGMRGVYLVAAELSRLGLIASPTSRGAAGADILATDPKCQEAWSVQVKTNAKTFGFWLIGKKAKEIYSPTHIYVFVNIRNTKKDGERIEYFVVPSKVVSKKMHELTSWSNFKLADAEPYRNKWSVLGV